MEADTALLEAAARSYQWAQNTRIHMLTVQAVAVKRYALYVLACTPVDNPGRVLAESNVALAEYVVALADKVCEQAEAELRALIPAGLENEV